MIGEQYVSANHLLESLQSFLLKTYRIVLNNVGINLKKAQEHSNRWSSHRKENISFIFLFGSFFQKMKLLLLTLSIYILNVLGDILRYQV